MTPAPPDAPPPGEVCGDGVASVDDRYECAAGGRLSLGRPGAAPARRRIRAWRAPRPGLAVWSAWAARLAASCRAPVAGGPRDRPRGCPRGGRGPCRRRVRRRRAARRASHAPHPAPHPPRRRLSACRVGNTRQPISCVCVCAMRRSSDIGRVTSIAMVTSIWMITSIGMDGITSIWMITYIIFHRMITYLDLDESSDPSGWSLPSGWWPRSGEWRLVRASPSRLSRRGSAPRRPVGARARLLSSRAARPGPPLTSR